MKSQKKESKFLELPRAARTGSIVIGIVLIALAAALYIKPPKRASEVAAVPSANATVSITQTKADSEPSSVVIAAFTAGVAFVAFGLNGIKMTRLSSPMVELGAGPIDMTVPPTDKYLEPPPAVAGGGVAQNLNPPAPEVVNGAHTLGVLVTPMMPVEFRPAEMPGPPFPTPQREPRPGQQITVEPGGLRNATSVYFFSHDLMLAFAALITNSPRVMVIHTASCAAHHLSQMGFAATPFHSQLREIIAECVAATDAQLTPARRAALAAEIFRLSRTVGNIVERMQQNR
jgi:hypothetical protein